VKTPKVRVEDLATSTDRNDQLGRYLAQTGAVILSTVRSFGLLAVKPGAKRTVGKPIRVEDRELLAVVHLWETEKAFRERKPVLPSRIAALADLVEQAVVEFSPIADPAVLASVLAAQARRAKDDLPQTFEAVQSLLEDYGTALGLTFEGEQGQEFFRSSLIQTAFYALFAGWTLWHRENDGKEFTWERIDRYLKIPFLAKLFYEFRHPDRLEELHLAKHLDRATETLGRVDREAFFRAFKLVSLREEQDVMTSAAITYFYEPFLQAFDPTLRKELGVWYTPPEIVRYQVQKIDKILREDLGCPRGFADDQVVVLDPCCGTGAYLIEVIRCIVHRLQEEGDDALLATRLLQAVSRRIIGFEILTAPFVIAQLQLYVLLAELGAAPSPEDRPAVFLTNALTGWEGPENIKLNFPELKREHEAARTVKREAPIIVVLGNPPYNRFAGAAMKEEADLVDHYKGIKRDEEERQIGPSLLFKRFGIRKQLLDDLYIRFFRLAEQRIGERAKFGVVSFISNSSFLGGLSHPIMRESLLSHFHTVWVDNMHGNRLASERTPWGGSCETLFNLEGAPGIKVGTCVTTWVKHQRPQGTTGTAQIFYRDFWGRADAKRRALLSSVDMKKLGAKERAAAAERPEGPREYVTVPSDPTRRWTLRPGDAGTGYEAWPALDELFPHSFQGINPNRGLEGSVIDVDERALTDRMKRYFSAKSFEEVAEEIPELAKARARYEPKKVWEKIHGQFDSKLVVPYVLFPLDARWIYLETRAKFLNEARREYVAHLNDNEFLVAVPQARRVSETRAVVTTGAVDLHHHDRGSVCFPRTVRPEGLFSGSAEHEQANLSATAWDVLQRAWKLKGDLRGVDAQRIVMALFRVSLVVLHSPAFEEAYGPALVDGYAGIPLPRDRKLLDEAVTVGDQLAVLLDPLANADKVLREVLGKRTGRIAVPARTDGKTIAAGDLGVTISYYGAAGGRWVEDNGGSLFLNDDVFLSGIPSDVWQYELGGYPVMKKWLGYRHVSRLGGRPLTLAELDQLRTIAQRIAAVLELRPALDDLQGRFAADAFTADELRVKKA
jgi:Type ISP C-terminal specificity domain/N-6 DNA Methylase